ncbi:adenylate/guanylate cyclase domain-containing protein [Desulfobacterota bacterium AH_259_B03_O07]|nr:adenylate/guanylate cyclase domain-containing protein [Desulfobacterota bacterium AH_259_B03_O07]
MFNEQIKKTITLGLASFAIFLIIFFTGILDKFELKAFDLYSRFHNPKSSTEDIIIVEIDQLSIDELNGQAITWPWPRQVYAPIVDYLSEAEAVFIDILFTEPSSYGHEDDQIFSDSIKKASNVHLPVFLTKKEKEMSSKDKEFLKRIALNLDFPTNLEFNSAITPIDLLKDPIIGSGNVTISPDDDGIYRKIPLFFRLNEFVIPHFLLDYLIQKGVVKLQNNSIYTQNTKIPLIDGKLILRYYRANRPFKVFSASEILKAYLDSKESITPPVKKEFFRGKYVFIGFTAPGLYDLKPTSVSSISTGVLIHATTLENILNRNYMIPVNKFYVLIAIFIICLLTSYFVLRSHSLLLNLSLFILSILLILIFTGLLFKISVYFDVIAPLFSLILAFTIVVAYSYATEGKQRVLIERTLLQYMDKKIAGYLLDNPSLIKPGGLKKRVTVFFVDIVGFTSIAEKTSPEEISKMLHEVLNSLTEDIIDNNGVIDKYIGDCVMAFWGAPLDSERDELNACLAGLKSMQSIENVNEEFIAKNLPEISIRIGIHSGEALAGNLGSDRIFNYTVIGDTVNIASRIESINRFFGTNIIISEDTLIQTENLLFTRELGMIEVKGKTIPLRIYELIGVEENIGEDKRDLVRQFDRGVRCFKDKKWEGALEIFNNLHINYPKDGPSEFYKKRCEYLISNEDLTEDWNVIKFIEK